MLSAEAHKPFVPYPAVRHPLTEIELLLVNNLQPNVRRPDARLCPFILEWNELPIRIKC